MNEMYDEAETEIRGSSGNARGGPGLAPRGRLTPNDGTIIPQVGSNRAMAWVIPTTGLHAGQPLRLDPSGTVIGRDPSVCQIVLDDPRVSGMHAKVRAEKIDDRFRFHIVDMGSRNGTYVDHTRIDRCPLKDGACIRVGGIELVFKQSTI